MSDQKVDAMDVTQDVQQLDSKSLNRFSRQNAAFGAETTAKLTKLRVIVVGLRGVGIETAKNLSLQGVGALTLIDSAKPEPEDLGVNFFILESDIGSGKSRADTVLPRIKELNPICKFAVAEQLTEDLILQHSAVVITQILPLDELVKLNDFCRSKNISFFYCFTGGVHGSVFVDHGDNHKVFDLNGERPDQKLIIDIAPLPSDPTQALVRYDHPAGRPPNTLHAGDFEVTEVLGVDGIDGINDRIYACTHHAKDPVKTLRVPLDVRTLPPYVSGGLLTEKKLPKPYPMQSLAAKLKAPGDTFAEPPTLVLTDLLNFGSELQSHVAFVAVALFHQQHQRLPQPNSADDAAAVVALARRALADKVVDLPDFDLNEEWVSRFALHAGAELQPLAAFLGGVLAQEVVKCTGKFTPIPGFLHYACPEALPDARPAAEDVAPRGHRNDELASVYGWTFAERLANLRYFMVGCGALGCEFMKNFALNSVCCGPQGSLTVTDADRIELSNLSRQFLFREHNVGQPKSRAAAAMAKVMNAGFNVEALEMFVGTKTENHFNDAFWTHLDGVCNALDNMEARLYVDGQCVKYEKSLLESGTMGPSGNVDTIVPFKTRTYGEGGQAADMDGVPMCTLRNFPQITDHCIEWARDQFELLFAKLGKQLDKAVTSPAAFAEEVAKLTPSDAAAELRCVVSFARAALAKNVDSAAQLAFDVFHFLFRDRILNLQAQYPRDARIIDPKTGADKGPFWGEKKRFPTAAIFNPNDESHLTFLRAATALFAVNIGALAPKVEGDEAWLAGWRSDAFAQQLAARLTPPPYAPCPMHVEGESEETTARVKAEAQLIVARELADLQQLAARLGAQGPLALAVADFEKDDDANFHIAFITAAANLRCDNYSIKRTDFHATKVIAGKIIAAIATTTAAVCGLVMLELFKVQLGKPTDAYMNRQVGLGTNTYTSFTQEAPRKHATYTSKVVPDQTELPADAFDEKGQVKAEYIETETHRAYPEGHSLWDKLEVRGDLSVEEFAEWLEEHHGLELQQWDFVYGYRQLFDEDGKKKGVGPVTARVYPAHKPLNYELLPALDLSKGEALKALMRSPAVGGRSQQYLAAWEQCKEAGRVEPPAADPFAVTPDTTLAQVLGIMQAKGQQAEDDHAILYKTVSCIGDRQFWVIPSPEAPNCVHVESGDEVGSLASFKILLHK